MHVFLLSLPDSRRRRLSAIGKIQQTGIPFEIVDGVEALKMHPEQLKCTQHALTWMKPGEVGCYMGHMRCLQRMVDYGLPYAMVLEDDFCFESNPSFPFHELDANLPPHFHFIHLQRDIGINSEYRQHGVEGCYWRVSPTPLGTVGYVIERSLAEYVLKNHALCELPIDHMFSSLSSRGRFYQPLRPLVGIQFDLPSDTH